MVRNYDLAATDNLMALLGGSIALAEGTMAEGRRDPALVSTIKIRQAGFHECMDTADSVRKWFRRFQELRLIPSVTDADTELRQSLAATTDIAR